MKKALLILVLCLIGCSQQEAPLSCDKKFVRDGILSHWKLTCIARFDEILVKDVVANRGNWVCPFRESEPQKFGDEFFVRCIEKKKDDYGNHASCNGEVLELHFETIAAISLCCGRDCEKKAREGSSPAYSYFKAASL